MHKVNTMLPSSRPSTSFCSAVHAEQSKHGNGTISVSPSYDGRIAFGDCCFRTVT